MTLLIDRPDIKIKLGLADNQTSSTQNDLEKKKTLLIDNPEISAKLNLSPTPTGDVTTKNEPNIFSKIGQTIKNIASPLIDKFTKNPTPTVIQGLEFAVNPVRTVIKLAQPNLPPVSIPKIDIHLQTPQFTADNVKKSLISSLDSNPIVATSKYAIAQYKFNADVISGFFGEGSADQKRTSGQNFEGDPTATFTPKNQAQKFGVVGYNILKDLTAYQGMGINASFDEGLQAFGETIKGSTVIAPKLAWAQQTLGTLADKSLAQFINQVKPLKLTMKDLQDVNGVGGAVATPEQLSRYQKAVEYADKVGVNISDIVKASNKADSGVRFGDFIEKSINFVKNGIKKVLTPEETKLLTSGEKLTVNTIIKPGEYTGDQILRTVLDNKLGATEDGKQLIQIANSAKVSGKTVLVGKPGELSSVKSETLNPDSYVYHGTSNKNLESIAQEGLKAPQGETATFFHKLESSASKYGGSDNAVIRIDKSKLPEGSFYDNNTFVGGSKTPIPPDALEVKVNGEWKPITLQQPSVSTLGKEVTVFRGAKDQAIDVTRPQGITNGVSFSISKGVAQRFADKNGGTVQSYSISPDAKVMNLSDLEAQVKDVPVSEKNTVATQYLKDNQIDVVRNASKKGTLNEQELTVINPDVIKPLETPKYSPENVDMIRDAIFSGDIEAAKVLHSDLSKSESLPTFEDIQKEVESFQEAEIASIKSELGDTGSLAVDSPDRIMSEIADKLSAGLKGRGEMLKLTGKPRVYETAEGTLKVGGDVKSILDNLVFGTDIEGFAKNINILASKFDKWYTDISNIIKAGDIDGADYDKFKDKLATIINEKPSNNAGIRVASKDLNRSKVNTETKRASNATNENLPSSKNAEVSSTSREIRGTGETKVRGLSAGVEANAIAKKLTDAFGDLPEYKSVNMDEMKAKAVELLNTQPELAKRIAMGLESVPKGLNITPESLFVAVENRAVENGDIATIHELGTASQLVTEATTMGQRIRTLAERDPDSPVAIIQEVVKERVRVVEQKLKGKSPEKVKENIKNALKEKIAQNKPSKYSWEAFLEEIQC